MVSPFGRSWSRVLGEEDSGEEQEDTVLSTADEGTSEAATEPDYSFEGYSVEFIDKVALLPVTQVPTATAQRSRNR